MQFVLVSLCITGLAANLLVTIPNGDIQGKVESSKVNAFLKIPYAAAPIGNLRFSDPLPFTDAYDGGIYDATTSGPACPQEPGLVLPIHPQSEDCLYLKVVVPNTSPPPNTLYPVLIFIHGGGYYCGSGLDLFSDIKTMVETSINNNNPIIAVTINYRIGVLGFLYDEKYETGISGNFGIKDQALAIKWVNQNIEAFGGDPNKITLYGESAGASSVGIHLTNTYLSDISNSIVGAIMSSPYVGQPLNTKDIFENGQFGETFIDETGCQSTSDILGCLKDSTIVSTETLLAIQKQFPFISPNFVWSPIVDKTYIRYQVWRAFENGYGIWSSKNRNMNILIGYNKEEGLVFSYDYLGLVPDITINTMDDLKTFLINRDTEQISNVDIAEATDIYNSIFDVLGINDNTITTAPQALDTYSDFNIFKCPINNIANSIASNGNHNIYKYYFTQVDPTLNALTFGNYNPNCQTTACHAQELYYIFRSPQVEAFFGLFIPGYTYSQTVIDTSTNLQKVITSFTTDGTTGITTDIWPQYQLNDRVSKEISLPALNNNAVDINPEQCSTLDDIGYAADFNNINPKQCVRRRQSCSVTNDCCGALVCNQFDNECKPCIHLRNKNKRNVKCMVNDDCCHGLICDVEKGECNRECINSDNAAIDPKNGIYISLYISWSQMIGAALILFVSVVIISYHCIVRRKKNKNKYFKVDTTSTDDEERI